MSTTAPVPSAARLLLPFTQRAEHLPAHAEQVLREGMAWLAEVGNGGRIDAEEELGLIRAAQRYVDRHYPIDVAA